MPRLLMERDRFGNVQIGASTVETAEMTPSKKSWYYCAIFQFKYLRTFSCSDDSILCLANQIIAFTDYLSVPQGPAGLWLAEAFVFSVTCFSSSTWKLSLGDLI